MPGDVAATAANDVIIPLGPRFVGHHGRGVEQARHTDVVERIVGIALGTLGLGHLPGDRRHHRLHISRGLGQALHAFIAISPAAAGTVAVEMGHAMLVEIAREGVGKPRRPGIAPGRMAGPPRQPHPALELIAQRPQGLGHGQHAGVAGAVVADALAPAVVMAVQQDKFGVAIGSGDFDHGQVLREPAGFQLGLQRDARALGGQRDQPVAAWPVHRDRRDLGQARKVRQFRRAPDGRHGAPVNIDARIDGDGTDGADGLKPCDKIRQRKAFDHRDLATRALQRPGAGGVAVQRGAAPGLGHVDQLAFDPFRARQGKGGRFGAQHRAIRQRDRGSAGQRQVDFGLMQGDWDALGPQRLGDHFGAAIGLGRDLTILMRKGIYQRRCRCHVQNTPDVAQLVVQHVHISVFFTV